MSTDLKKRDCGIAMRLVPYGGGWTDVYLDINGDHLYFIISSAFGHQFNDLLRALYHMYPTNGDPENADELFEHKYGICHYEDNSYNVKEIVDSISDRSMPFVAQDIPWKATFTWDEEVAQSDWLLEREPTLETNFMLKIYIDIRRGKTESHTYEVRYTDFCYAVAKACTEALKSYGFYGYHHSVYTEDMNIRYLLFLKSVALNNFEARELTFYQEKGHGETTDFQKELELLLFDM